MPKEVSFLVTDAFEIILVLGLINYGLSLTLLLLASFQELKSVKLFHSATSSTFGVIFRQPEW